MTYTELNSLTLAFVAVALIVVIINWLISKLKIKDIANRFVFITGCDTGFGNQLAKRLDAAGVKVIAGCLTEAGKSRLEDETSSRLKVILIDVANKQSVEGALKVVKETVKEHGKLLFIFYNLFLVFFLTVSLKDVFSI